MIHSTRRAAMRGACALCAAATLVFAANAGIADTATPAITLKASPEASLQLASSGLNLLQNPRPRSAPARRVKAAMGSGSYICSPAGFGQPSRCYSN